MFAMLVTLILLIVFLFAWIVVLNGKLKNLAKWTDDRFALVTSEITTVEYSLTGIKESVDGIIETLNPKYSDEFKEECVAAIKGGKSIRAVSKEKKVPYSTLRTWASISKEA